MLLETFLEMTVILDDKCLSVGLQRGKRLHVKYTLCIYIYIYVLFIIKWYIHYSQNRVNYGLADELLQHHNSEQW